MEWLLTAALTTKKEENRLNLLKLPWASGRVALMMAAHIGSGDDAHLPADNQHAGFLTPQQWLKFRSGVGYREHTYETDLLKLNPGRYWGVGFTNGAPGDDNKGMAYIDIDKIDDAHTMYRQTMSFNGKSYVKITHGNNDALPNGYGQECRSYTLWEGGVSRQGTTFQLSDSINKFSELEFTVCTTAKVDVVRVKRRDNMVVNARDDLWDSSIGVSFYECLFDVVSDNSTRITLSKNISYALSGNKLAENTDVAEVWKIRGIS
ncbi:hypothetical protein GBP00_00105 [Pediococcus acidilactici]|uniref:hypothetical protein n=1 Tax=Pediococcus acidilactici TaxID=1254 RepID=UPI001330F719|nr:hypothetical protein [Pediococcus acidilactici]KAF0463085.1 hypothetical protein GBP00_00105 [Pediococcus acidilactici]KAF0535927.1 hypothetical protein GBP38_01225 [Pediococcus acidilactici]KAF0799990.1 hypothetical protein GBO83_07570 [Pediococcus acidilactici]